MTAISSHLRPTPSTPQIGPSPPTPSPFEFIPQDQLDSELVRHIGFVPGLKEVLVLRQVHALEHATVWVLGELMAGGDRQVSLDQAHLGGLSTEHGFYLYGTVNTLLLRRAVRAALRRLTDGDWHLAVHPRCGTNVSVNLALTAGLALGLHLLLPRSPLEQLLGLGLAASAASQMTPDIGNLVQQYVTTAIPFNLEIEHIYPLVAPSEAPGHFIQVRWVDRVGAHPPSDVQTSQ